jgi:hypothetical protein
MLAISQAGRTFRRMASTIALACCGVMHKIGCSFFRRPNVTLIAFPPGLELKQGEAYPSLVSHALWYPLREMPMLGRQAARSRAVAGPRRPGGCATPWLASPYLPIWSSGIRA